MSLCLTHWRPKKVQPGHAALGGAHSIKRRNSAKHADSRILSSHGQGSVELQQGELDAADPGGNA